ncbi:hypothetical protein Pmani_033114 [Petrolisthes manimaculis]|uniref:Uncharacterized protein n=1 Tax=Petrolisthes manimaculis TaxID=1843537 RepID=A0AAE1TT21_9EUCA|nr:hypothetical protein Pmani_033114 [Petrolisthes manimaculis]
MQRTAIVCPTKSSTGSQCVQPSPPLAAIVCPTKSSTGSQCVQPSPPQAASVSKGIIPKSTLHLTLISAQYIPILKSHAIQTRNQLYHCIFPSTNPLHAPINTFGVILPRPITTPGVHPILPHHRGQSYITRPPSHIATPHHTYRQATHPQGPHLISPRHTTIEPNFILPHHHLALFHIAMPHHHRASSHIATPSQGLIPYCHTTGPHLIATPLGYHHTPSGPIITTPLGPHDPHTNAHHSHHRVTMTLTPMPIVALGPITLTPMPITHTTGSSSPSHQCPSITPQGPHGPHTNAYHLHHRSPITFTPTQGPINLTIVHQSHHRAPMTLTPMPISITFTPMPIAALGPITLTPMPITTLGPIFTPMSITTLGPIFTPMSIIHSTRLHQPHTNAHRSTGTHQCPSLTPLGSQPHKYPSQH